MKTSRLLSVLALFAHALASAAPATSIVEKDGFVRDVAGRTLYVFAHDSAGKSTCIDACNKSWPPFLAAQDAQANAQLTLVGRADGAQWAYRGQALYYFVGDSKAGDMLGDGVGGVWHAARSPAAGATPAKLAPATAYGY